VELEQVGGGLLGEYEIQLGSGALVCHVEERMKVHLQKMMPSTLESLQKILVTSKERADAIKYRSPVSWILAIVKLVNVRMVDTKEVFQTDFRVLLNQLSRAVRKLGVRSLVSPGENRKEFLSSECADGLETGTEVMVGSLVSGWVFEKIRRTPSEGAPYFDPYFDYNVNTDDGRQVWAHEDSIAIPGESPMSLILAEIEVVTAKKSGLRNMAHADPQIPLNAFAKDFADQYKDILHQFLDRFRLLVQGRLTTVFSKKNVSETGQSVLAAFHASAMAGVEQLVSGLNDWIADVASWNNVTDLIFSENDHYLNETYARFISAETTSSGKTDLGSSTLHYYRIQVGLLCWKPKSPTSESRRSLGYQVYT
jgi:hypothetical protein